MAAAKPDEWSYAASLTVAAEAAGLPKTARTRLRVLAALAGQLNLVEDPAAIRVSDVMVKAGLAHGTFYRYFADQDAALEDLSDGFLSFLNERQAQTKQGAVGSPERIHHSIAVYCRVFRANIGLMGRLMSLELAWRRLAGPVPRFQSRVVCPGGGSDGVPPAGGGWPLGRRVAAPAHCLCAGRHGG